MSDRNFNTTVEERDFYKERYERLLRVWNDEEPLREQVSQLERQLDAALTGQTMTLKAFDERPREDWDFSELHDHLQEVIADRDRIREQIARLDRRASVYHDANLYWLHKAGERVEENTLLRASVKRLEARLENSRAANNLRQRRLDAAVIERDRLRDAARGRAGTVMTRLDFLMRDLCEMDEAECGADTTLHVSADQLRTWLEIWIEEGRLILPDLQPASLSERQREGGPK